jgi:translation initiation factor 3 subunit M
MPGPTNTLLIEGTTEELADELAQYIDNLKRAQNAEGGPIQPEVASLMQEKKTEEALKKIMTSASVLNYAPEKGMAPCVPLLVSGTLLKPYRDHRSIQSSDLHNTTSAQA